MYSFIYYLLFYGSFLVSIDSLSVFSLDPVIYSPLISHDLRSDDLRVASSPMDFAFEIHYVITSYVDFRWNYILFSSLFVPLAGTFQIFPNIDPYMYYSYIASRV